MLTTLVAQDKVHAWFDVSEQAGCQACAPVKGQGRAPGGDGAGRREGFPHAGSVDFVDNRLNPATGAIRVRALFDNKERRFAPGLFARAAAGRRGQHGGADARSRHRHRPDQALVFVVGADKSAQFREVQLGPLVGGGMRIIAGGLKAGELVVVNGLQRVRLARRCRRRC